MKNVVRPAPFVLLSTNHGSMIINRHDHAPGQGEGYGVGYDLMRDSCYAQEEVDFVLALLAACLRDRGEGVIAIDCGANVGVHTIEWARFMYGWGHVVAFEAQEKIYYALAGNIALNNCLNVNAFNSAVGAAPGTMAIPQPDYLRPGSFGSLALRQGPRTEHIGQDIDYAHPGAIIDVVALDALGLARVDLIKIDVEGMELEVLEGARGLLETARPLLFVETLKTDPGALASFLDGVGYRCYPAGMNMLAVHRDDALVSHLREEDGQLTLV